MNRASQSGLTWVEVLVTVVVILVFAILALPFYLSSVTPTLARGQMNQMLSNMKQLHLATQSLVLDGEAGANTNGQWPGDADSSFATWATSLAPDYLSSNDFRKLISGPGLFAQTNTMPTANTNAVLVYSVRKSSATNTVFLTSANFTNSARGGTAPSRESRPFRTNGIVILRRDGTGDILKISSAGKTNKVGVFAPLCQ